MSEESQPETQPGAQAETQLLFFSPLMEPDRWVITPDDVLPLDLAAVGGGPMRRRLLRLAEDGKHRWFLPRLADPIVLSRVAEWLRTYPPRLVYFDASDNSARQWLETVLEIKPAEINRPVRADVELIPAPFRASGVSRWAKEIFVEFTARIGEPKLRALLTIYSVEFPEAIHFPWDGLRYFAGFLRPRGARPRGVDAQGVSAADVRVAVRDWSRFMALFSPQAETSEASSLIEDELMLNPTLQILRPDETGGHTPDHIEAYYRKDDRLVEATIDWRGALLLDGIAEHARVPAPQLLHLLASDDAHYAAILEADEPRTARALSATLEGLIQSGVVLRGDRAPK